MFEHKKCDGFKIEMENDANLKTVAWKKNMV